MPGDPNDENFHSERAAHLEAILSSQEARKVIVAGPGTGKTFTFKQLLKGVEPPTLVLTFIRNLVADLGAALGAISDVRTFHGFARWMLHSREIIPGVHYYPFLPEIIESDLRWIGPSGISLKQIESALQTLDEGDPSIQIADRSADYYGAVGHDFAVFKVLKHFQDNPVDIPSYNQVVVDEYQDFNALEVALIEELAKKSPVLVVGDDDQALYAFKHATPEHLRRLYKGDQWASFALPFCSRCTALVVAATHRLVEEAQRRNLLVDRIDKPFTCFLPTKRADSEKYPRIIHARCSVHMKKAPYIARYIEECVRGIDDQDVRDCQEDGNPTILVIGPAYITGPVYDYLELMFPKVAMMARPESGFSILDGYELLLRDPRSRLGWRILTMVDIPPTVPEILERTLVGGEELADVLPDDYRNRNLRVVGLIQKLRKREPITEEERAYLESCTGVSSETLVPSNDEPPGEPSAETAEADSTEEVVTDENELVPSIVVTRSLVASKGLQAEHVFVLGVHSGSLPKNPGAPLDSEVCELLVALTRSKKSCHIVTADRLFGQRTSRSPFIEWLGELVEEVYISKDSFVDGA